MLIIRNARLLTMEEQDYEYGDIAIEDGKLLEIGHGIVAAGDDEIIDAKGLWAMPGMVDAHCHIGLWENGMGDEGADGNESVDPITPHLRAIDAINPLDYCFTEAREHGITTVVTGPGSANVFGGLFVAMKTAGTLVDDMIIKFPCALKIALGENPKRVYEEQKKSPITRMATAALLRETFVEAQEYQTKLQLGQEDADKLPERDLRLEAVCLALRREIPVKAHAHRADDIQTAVRIAKEFNLDLSIDHCTEGHLITDFLKHEDARIILGPLLSERSKIELKNLTFKAPGIMERAGIEFAIMTDHPVIPTQYLPICAAIAVKEGLSEDGALKAITINAARVNGIEDRVGSLAPGKDADVVLLDGHPLDIRSKVVRVLIDGETIYKI